MLVAFGLIARYLPLWHAQADHDKGVVWPPPKGYEGQHAKFMGMVKEPSLYSNEVGGIMVGYKGHVPRARDKIGCNPLGGMPNGRSAAGFPPPELTSPVNSRAYGTQSSKPAEPDRYVSVAHAVQFDVAESAATGTPSSTKLNSKVAGDGFIPRYAGHMPNAINKAGGSVYGSPTKNVTVAPSTFEWHTVYGNYKYNEGNRGTYALALRGEMHMHAALSSSPSH